MSDSEKILVAGLGSPHGDDQAGWLVAERVGEQFRSHPDVVVRRAIIPLDLLDWLEDVDVLHICDACETTQRHEKLQRFAWNGGQLMASDIPHAVGIDSFNRVPSGPREERPVADILTRGALPTRLNNCDNRNRAQCISDDSDMNAALKLRRGRSSHDFGLLDVLRLAEKTGQLPKQVIVWAIAGNCFQPKDVMSDETRATVSQAVKEIVMEMSFSHA